MESIQRLLRYRAHKLIGQPSWKIAAYGMVTKQYMGRIAQAHRSIVKNKQNSSVNFLVRAKFLMWRRW